MNKGGAAGGAAMVPSEEENSGQKSGSGASDLAQIVLAFDNNREAMAVFGQFDENLGSIEKKLGLDVRAQGNEVTLTGSQLAVKRARQVLDMLHAQVKQGGVPTLGDVDGALALAVDSDRQLELPSLEARLKPRIAQIATRKKTVSARTPVQDAYMRAMERAQLVFGVGPAGTGKTYLAVAHAASLLERGQVSRIILSRPAVEAGERLGFLPGDLREKIDPYLRPLYDALYDMMAPDKVERGLMNGVIEIAPLAFMRGRTLENAAIILDEAQNTTSMQMKMFLTRFGEGSRMIVTGDPSQTDLPSGQQSGLVEALHLLENIDDIVAVRFGPGDVVRHRLVSAIVQAYEARDHKKRAPGKES